MAGDGGFRGELGATGGGDDGGPALLWAMRSREVAGQGWAGWIETRYFDTRPARMVETRHPVAGLDYF